MAKLEIESTILVGAESKAWLSDLENLVTRMEKVTGKTTTKKSAKTDTDLDDTSLDEDNDDGEDFTKSTKPKNSAKKASSFSDDSDEDDTDEKSEIEAASMKGKRGRPKKITIDDVNDACKTRAEETSRKEVLKILKGQFDVTSVTDLEPKQYAEVIEAMQVE